MPSNRTLFGKKIVPHHMVSFTEQVYDILVGEIQLGRWQPNERLPGVIHLAKDLGFGTKTVQAAYDRLKQEGYLASHGSRGTYLKSLHPQATSASKKIGILIAEEQTGDPLTVWYQHVILHAARRKHLVTDMKTISSSPGMEASHTPQALFGTDAIGIISLTPIRVTHPGEVTSPRVPLVYLCPPFERCSPKVCADVRQAYYDLTSRLIAMGHTRIAFSEDAVEPDPRQTDLHREGFLDAMHDQGLDVDFQAIAATREIENSKPGMVSSHLKKILGGRKSSRPTAIVAGSLGRAMVLTRLAPALGFRIPQDLSIASIGTAHIDGHGEHEITGMLPDFDYMIETCFRMLEQQRERGRSEFTSVSLRMHLVPGNTVAAPDNAPLKRRGRT